ncbi:RDD family protein [Oerskovia sp. M15]
MFVVIGPGIAPSMLPGLDNWGSLGPASGGLRWSESLWMIGAVLTMALLQAYTGATPGKRTMGIAVVNRDTGRPVGIVTTILRWLAHFLDAILWIGYLRPCGTRNDAPSRTACSRRSSCSPAPSAARRGGPLPAVGVRHAGRHIRHAGRDDRRDRPVQRGVLYAWGPTAWQGTSFGAACTTWTDSARQDPVTFTGATFSYSGTGTITRWGITHPDPAARSASTATLDWEGAVEPGTEADLEVVLTSADGATEATFIEPVDADGSAHGTFSTSTGSVTIPASAFDELGDDWTWTAQMRLEGVSTRSCGGAQL